MQLANIDCRKNKCVDKNKTELEFNIMLNFMFLWELIMKFGIKI